MLATNLLFNFLLGLGDLLLLGLVRRSGAGLLALTRGILALGALACLTGWLVREDLFHLLRLASYVVFGHLPAVLFGGFLLLRRRSRGAARACAAAALGLALIAIDAFLIEPRWLSVREVRLSSTKLSRPLRIVVVADLQTDAIGAYERRALQRARDLEPDLLLFCGDYLQIRSSSKRAEQGRAFAELLRELKLAPPLGVFAVRGNIDAADWAEPFAGVATTFETTRSLDTGEVRLTGLGLWPSFRADLRIAGSERYHIVFGHAPNFALGAIGADLLIAGHTHGGQVRLPLFGPLLTFSRVPRSWASGATELDAGSTLVVSRGVGMERASAPRMRFLCRPELIVVEVQPRAASG